MDSYAYMSHIIMVRRRIFFKSSIVSVYSAFWADYYYEAYDNINTNLNG